MNRDRRPVVVVAAIIERNGRFLVAKRLAGTHLSGLWEFPGGKCESHEDLAGCLARELEEELGVAATIGAEVLQTEHAYPEKTVRLHFHRCDIAGDPQPRLGQDIQWVSRDELKDLEFPAADKELIDLLLRS